MNLLKNSLEIFIITLIVTFGMNNVFAAENSIKTNDAIPTPTSVKAIDLIKPLSDRERLLREALLQGSTDKIRERKEKQRLNKKIRPKRKTKRQLLAGDMDKAADDICLNYKTYPDTYAITYDSIAKMSIPTTKKAMNDVIGYCGKKNQTKDINLQSVRSVLIKLYDSSAIESNPDHFILRGLKICENYANNKELAKKYNEVIAFYKSVHWSDYRKMESLIKSCSDLSNYRMYGNDVHTIESILKNFETKKQKKIERDAINNEAIEKRKKAREDAQTVDRLKYAKYKTIREKIAICEGYVQSEIDKVMVQTQKIKNLSSKGLVAQSQNTTIENEVSKKITIEYKGSKLLASTVTSVLNIRKKRCSTRFSLVRARKDLIEAHQMPSSHKGKTIKERLVLIKQEKIERKKRNETERGLKKRLALNGNMFDAADDICANYKADPNVFARNYNAIAEMDVLALKSMDYVIDYCEGDISREDLKVSTVKRVLYEFHKPSRREPSYPDHYILRGLNICERYQHDPEYSKKYDEMVGFYKHQDHRLMKAMIENTCKNISKNRITKIKVNKIEFLFLNFEKDKADRKRREAKKKKVLLINEWVNNFIGSFG